MKKILFVCKYPTCVSENLKGKFDGEMNALVKLGYEVSYLEWDGEHFFLVNLNKGSKSEVFITKTKDYKKYYHAKYFIDLFKVINKLLVNNCTFDIFYVRYMPFFSFSLRTFNKFKRVGGKLIIEIPSYPIEKELKREKVSLRKLILYYNRFWATQIFKKVDLLAVCGEKIQGEAYGRKAINIYNGIDVDRLTMRKPIYDKENVHVLLLASMCYWHGYERVIEGMRDYTLSQNVQIHFVGNDGDGSLAEWKSLVEKYGLERYFVFHGALYDEQLDEMINLCDIGISTIGMHKKDGSNASSLKDREYMGRGLPFLCSDGTASYVGIEKAVLYVSDDANPINMEQVVQFALEKRKDVGIIEEMRTYARNHMSWIKEFQNVMNAVEGR